MGFVVPPIAYMPTNRQFDSIEPTELALKAQPGERLPGLLELAAESCPKEMPCGKGKNGQVTAPEAFYLGDCTSLKCSELSAGGVFDASERIDQPLERGRQEVKSLIIKESCALGPSSAPNFRVEPDGTIREIRDPHKKLTEFDPAITIEVANGPQGQGCDYTERQKAALRQLLGYVQTNWSDTLQLDESTSDPKLRILSAVFVDPDVDGSNFDGNVRGWPALPKAEPRKHYWEDLQKNFWNIFDADSGRKCGEYDRIDQMSDEQKSQFIDRVKKLISRNEGGYSTIALDDNGYGISVGIAQWNQKKGELPKLFRAWWDAAEAEKEGALPDLFKGWRKAAEADVHQKPEEATKTFSGGFNRFEEIFGLHAQTLLDEQKVREYPFTADTDESRDMMSRLRTALDDTLFRKVQDELVRNNVRRAINLAHNYSHHSTRFIAQVADVANQYGWNGCESFLRKANVANIPEDTDGECMAIQAFIDNTPPKTNTKTGEPITRTERDKRLDKEFPPKNASGSRLVTKYVF